MTVARMSMSGRGACGMHRCEQPARRLTNVAGLLAQWLESPAEGAVHIIAPVALARVADATAVGADGIWAGGANVDAELAVAMAVVVVALTLLVQPCAV